MNGYKKDYHLERKFHEFENMRELLRESAKRYADKTAFVTKIREKGKEPQYVNTSYAELFAAVGYVGSALWENALAGERIAIIGENSYNWCLAYFASSCGLGVTVPLDKLLQTEELESLLERSGAKAIFCDKKNYEKVRTVRRGGKTALTQVYGLDFDPQKEADAGEFDRSIVDLLIKGEELVNGGMREYLDAPINREAMAFLLFTSGTTARSKAVMLSQKNLMSVNYSMNCEEVFFPDDVCLHLLPLHHCYGMGGLQIFLTQGLKNVFYDGLKYITINLKEYGVSVMMTVPLLLENMYRKIIKTVEKQGMSEKFKKAKRICDISDSLGIHIRRRVFKAVIDQLGGRMRFLINGAAALDPVVAKGFNDLGILTVQGYGLTESSPTIATESYRYIKAGSVGRVLPHVEARIDDPDEDGIGELVVHGDNVFMGYYQDEEATKAVLEDGWFHTGDLAYFDADDYLFITGRKKNVIVMKNGKNVFPEEIENLVNNLPYVEESMVFARSKGSDLVLWIKVVYKKEYLEDNAMQAEELRARLSQDMDKINAGMPSYKMVKHILLSDKPTIKTTTLKTKRNDELHAIRKELEEQGLI